MGREGVYILNETNLGWGLRTDIHANVIIPVTFAHSFYHADQTHPEVVPFSSTTESQYDLYDKGISRMIITFGASGPKNPDRNAVHPGMEGMIALYRGNPEDYKHLKGYEYNKAMIDTRKKWAERNGTLSP